MDYKLEVVVVPVSDVFSDPDGNGWAIQEKPAS
jgi:hypothetical protein